MAAKRQRQAYVLKCTHSSDLFNEDRDLLSKSHCEDLEGEMDEDAEWADYGGRGWTFVTDEQDGLRDESSDGDDEEEEEEEKDGYRLDKLFGGAVHMEEEIEEGELEEHEQPAQEHKRRPPAAKFTTASELLSYKKYLTGLRDRQKDSEAEGILQALLSKKVRQADLEESGIRMELSSSHWQENGSPAIARLAQDLLKRRWQPRGKAGAKPRAKAAGKPQEKAAPKPAEAKPRAKAKSAMKALPKRMAVPKARANTKAAIKASPKMAVPKPKAKAKAKPQEKNKAHAKTKSKQSAKAKPTRAASKAGRAKAPNTRVKAATPRAKAAAKRHS
ncbi:unnamed protein product [Durusdinium trenchii]